MCRAGGRRCENHWTETQRARDLARRRKNRLIKKGATKKEIGKAEREYKGLTRITENEKRQKIITAIIDKGVEEKVPPESLEKLRTERAKLQRDTVNTKARIYGKKNVGYDKAQAEAIKSIYEPDGGFTYDIRDGNSPLSGFCYSPYPEYCEVYEKCTQVNADVLKEYHQKHRDVLLREDHYIGGWHDERTGKVYLDVSVISHDATKARKECLNKDQISYFDLQDFKSVEVNANATSGQGDKTETEPRAETKAETKTEPKAEPKTEVKEKPKTETKRTTKQTASKRGDTKAGTKTAAKTGTKATAKASTKTTAKTSTKTATKTTTRKTTTAKSSAKASTPKNSRTKKP